MGSTLWVDKTGYNDAAKNLIAALKDADNWGLRAADYKIPELKPTASGDYSPDDLTAAETRLSLAAMKYARDARGDRITDPSAQLSARISTASRSLSPAGRSSIRWRPYLTKARI